MKSSVRVINKTMSEMENCRDLFSNTSIPDNGNSRVLSSKYLQQLGEEILARTKQRRAAYINSEILAKSRFIR